MGGKWTTCRPMALDCLTAVERQLPSQMQKPKQLPLLGTASNPDQTLSELQGQLVALEELLPSTPERPRQIAHLQHSFGLHAPSVVANSTPEEREPLSRVIPICRAEIRHFIQNEHATSVSDVLGRRCRLAMVDAAEAERLRPLVEDELQQKFDRNF